MLRSEIKTLKEKVRAVLKDIPETRNSDKRLTVEFWKRFQPEYIVSGKYILLDDIGVLQSATYISRARAEVQNDDKQYPPTSFEIAKKRNWNEREWKIAMGYYVEPTGQKKWEM